MHVDLTITLGNILTVIATIASMAVMGFGLLSRLQRLEWKLNMIWKWYGKEHDLDGNSDD